MRRKKIDELNDKGMRQEQENLVDAIQIVKEQRPDLYEKIAREVGDLTAPDEGSFLDGKLPTYPKIKPRRNKGEPFKIDSLLDERNKPIVFTLIIAPQYVENLKDYISSDPSGFAYDFLVNCVAHISTDRTEKRGKHIKGGWLIERLKMQSARIYVLTTYWLEKPIRKWHESFREMIVHLFTHKLIKNKDIAGRDASGITQICMSNTPLGRLANSYGFKPIDKLKDSEFYKTYLSRDSEMTYQFFHNVHEHSEETSDTRSLREERIKRYTSQWISDLGIKVSPNTPQKNS